LQSQRSLPVRGRSLAAAFRGRAHIVIPSLVALAVGAMLLVSAGEALRPATPVEVAPVVFDRAADAASAPQPTAADPGMPGPTVQAPGWLEADPFTVACTALADGVVEEVLVLEGERVEAGQVVARLVKRDAEIALTAAAAELAAARAAEQAVQADLAAAQVDWENPVERNRALAVAEASLRETEAELAQLPALIAQERANFERLREEHARLAKAAESGATTGIELLIAARQADAQGAAVEALELSKPILEAQRDRLRAEVEAARRNAELRVAERRALDLASAEAARAASERELAGARLEAARLTLGRMDVVSPISGFVQRRLKMPGDKVMLGMDDPHSSHIVHLYDPAKLQVRVDVPLADASHVRVGQACEVVVDVLPDRTFAGEVTRITHEADLQKNTLQVKVRVIDPSPLLKPEMLTRVRFVAAGRAAGAATTPDAPTVLVPETAVRAEGDRSFVWVVRDRRDNRGRVEAVTVEAGAGGADGVEAGWVRVRAPLRPGDLLAVQPARLGAGDLVELGREGGRS